MAYRAQYLLAQLVAIVAAVAGVLAGSGLTVHPAWLTPDVTATASVVVVVCLALQPLLPSLIRTPSKREATLLSATVGVLPDDLADKHPEIIVPTKP